MRNVLSMLSDGGLLVLHALYRCNAYRVGERLFPSADLSKDDVVDSLVANGLIRGSIDVEVARCPENARYGYSGILLASGRKPHRRRNASQPSRHREAWRRPRTVGVSRRFLPELPALARVCD